MWLVISKNEKRYFNDWQSARAYQQGLYSAGIQAEMKKVNDEYKATNYINNPVDVYIRNYHASFYASDNKSN